MITVNPVFYREMLLLRRKTLKLGYVFSTLLFPLLYLFALGWGLGGRVQMNGGSYGEFLLVGLTAMTSMTNSFNLTASSVGMGRLFHRNCQVMMMSPASPFSIVTGYLMAGAVRGCLAAAVVALAGIVLFGAFPFNAVSALGLALNVALFSAAGLIVGLKIKDLEALAVVTNFVIMPMAFFSGTFFPLDGLPPLLAKALAVLPLTQVNVLMRAESFSAAAALSAALLGALLILLYFLAVRIVRRYNE